MKKFGPVRYYKTKYDGGFSAWLKGYENYGFGFEWGWKDELRGQDCPLVEIRIGKLLVLYFEKFKKGGFELHLLGFWWIP